MKLGIPWLRNGGFFESLCDWKSTLIPLILLGVTFAIASFGTWSTFISLGLLPVTINVVKKQCGIKNSSSFYFKYTLYSMIISFYVFETVTRGIFASITQTEYAFALAMGGCCIFCMFLTRHLCASLPEEFNAKFGTQPKKQSSIILDPVKKMMYYSYDYCRKCKRFVSGRDHHCVWINCCVGRVNKLAFVATVAFGTAWLVVTVMMNLTSICYPVYLLNGIGFNDGTSSTSRWLLIPTNCPDVYGKGQFMITLGYITSIYGIGVAILLTFVLIHQIRLMMMGVSYLEYRFGSYKKTPVVDGVEQEVIYHDVNAIYDKNQDDCGVGGDDGREDFSHRRPTFPRWTPPPETPLRG
ncbi:probable palmitoyltransferase ZDHHC11 [Folsomia candida]|uniref:Palmitoyltransferase n=1 Tax=Folsomia candida TaxID=158441 RepID=A0A226D1E9_FOLCA|nr:probable palmitoyltransferase ZDHHC11 [Folsomia candida]OXA38527.1 putative palmitoyltransferase ZDHHC11 [Folsomia candida]